MKHKKYGFTLVELLVVITVIAILAAISTATYNGIQRRAKEAIIRSDLSNFARLIEVYRLDHGAYPRANIPALRQLGFKASQSAYPNNVKWNFDYCVNSAHTYGGSEQYVLVVMTGYKTALYVSSNNSSPREHPMEAVDNSGVLSPCYNSAPSSVADAAGLTDVSVGISGYRPAGWADWTK